MDAEIVRTGELSPASATGYFDEIVRISSCERQARRIWSGRNGGWTCPRYFPKDRIRILTPPEGDATAMLRREISDPVIARIWLGAGKWNVGSLAVDRRRLTLTLLDGAVLASPTGTFTVGEGVCDISVLGEGSARIDMPVLFSGVTNAVLRGVAVKDGDVRVRRSEGVVVDLPLSGFKMPTRAVKSELDRVDAAAEWAEQHLEFEKAERLHSVIRKLEAETNE